MAARGEKPNNAKSKMERMAVRGEKAKQRGIEEGAYGSKRGGKYFSPRKMSKFIRKN